jgi:hypothetical protein
MAPKDDLSSKGDFKDQQFAETEVADKVLEQCKLLYTNGVASRESHGGGVESCGLLPTVSGFGEGSLCQGGESSTP